MEKSEFIAEKTLETSYGNIFYRFVGDPKYPLFLIVHGSGSSSGSHHYIYVLHEYAIRFLESWPLFMVAIDCPGYGKSTGLKSVIRTFPGKFLKEFIEKLTGKSNAFALMGHSQGGCSIFNAVLEMPSLTHILVQDRPVFGEINKLKGFNIPTLLIYDIEDDGHPVKQGKIIAKMIPKNIFITYKGSEMPYWNSDNLFDTILEFCKKFKIDTKGIMPIIENSHPKEIKKIDAVKQEIHKEIAKNAEKIEIHEEKKIINEKPIEIIEQIAKNQEEKKKSINSEILKSSEQSINPEFNCPICMDILWKPVKLPCGHYGCLECLRFSIIYNPKCPYCRADLDFTEKMLDKKIDTEFEKKIAQNLPVEIYEARKKRFADAQKNPQPAIKVEYGNTSEATGAVSGTKQKYNWKLFVKCVNSPISHPIAYVEFDINPGVKGAKPIKCDKEPYELDRSGNYEFGCEIKVFWKKELGLKEYFVNHTVTLGPKKTSKHFLQFLKMKK